MNTTLKILSVTVVFAISSLVVSASKEDLAARQALKLQAKVRSTPISFVDASYNFESIEQVKTSNKLETEIVKLENQLIELGNRSSEQKLREKLREEIRVLKQKKATEDKLTSYLNQLGALEAALEYNRILLEHIGNEIQKLKNLEDQTHTDKKTSQLINDIKNQKNALEQQRRKLESVLNELDRKKESVNLKMTALNSRK